MKVKNKIFNESLELHDLSNLMLEKLLMGEPVTVPELRDILNKKVLNFEFVKLDGEVRPAKGTTMMKYIPKDDQPSGLNSPSSDKVAAFYDLSKNAWRSVSNKSKDVVIAADDTGKPKVVISDKKPKEEKEPKPPIVNGEESPRPVADPVQPVVKPTIVPNEIPDTPDIKGDEFDDDKKALDTTDPNIVADDIKDDDIVVDVDPEDELDDVGEIDDLSDLPDPEAEEEVDDVDQFPSTDDSIEFPEDEIEEPENKEEDDNIDVL